MRKKPPTFHLKLRQTIALPNVVAALSRAVDIRGKKG
jgi:hypothetical protein